MIPCKIRIKWVKEKIENIIGDRNWKFIQGVIFFLLAVIINHHFIKEFFCIWVFISVSWEVKDFIKNYGFDLYGIFIRLLGFLVCYGFLQVIQ